jgi:hypothetical protein
VEEKKENQGGAEDWNTLHVHVFKDSIIKPTKHCIKSGGGQREEWEYNGGSGLVQSILYICMELPQWNFLVSLMYANSKCNKVFLKDYWQKNYPLY